MVSSASSESAIDQSNPYYIHPNENPALVLVSPPLDGSNYHGWSHAMRMALLSKNKLKFVDSALSRPSSTDKFFPCNNLVQGWLTKSLTPTIVKSILWLDSASETWKDLQSSEYYTQLKILWDELSNIRPIKACSCGSTDSAQAHIEKDYVIRFLRGLNEQYTSVKSQIMLVDPLSPINRVFSLVLQQEQELHLSVPSTPTVLLAKGPPRSAKPHNGLSKQCSYCGKPRHTEETCYRKHGFPPGFKFRSSAAVNNLSVPDSGIVQANSTAKPPLLPTPPSTTVSTASVLPQLSSEQYQRLLSLLASPQTPSSINHITSSPIPSSDTLNQSFSDDWFS
ncbi:uncharacterized protein LOC114761617 [Neltuma alba]|uniref:uncharacterized protein LOC114761617 n=1 Tax=Neltuma alba TaxID=207710 RepID=UPI0010A592B0|nr:uncharacterized protein LOC114761617 [Prosopis alba]